MACIIYLFAVPPSISDLDRILIKLSFFILLLLAFFVVTLVFRLGSLVTELRIPRPTLRTFALGRFLGEVGDRARTVACYYLCISYSSIMVMAEATDRPSRLDRCTLDGVAITVSKSCWLGLSSPKLFLAALIYLLSRISSFRARF